MASPAPSQSPTAGSASKKVLFDLQMGFDMLRQIKAQPFGNAFQGASPCFRLVAGELSVADPTPYGSLSTKGVKDRVLLLLDHPKVGDEWKKRQ